MNKCLKVLSLAGNSLDAIENLDGLPLLQELYL
jgi:hypothetical protein